MEEENLLFQSGKIEVQLPINDSNIDALIMILENLKVKKEEFPKEYKAEFIDEKLKKPKVFKKKEQTKEEGVQKKRTKKFPEGMKGFIERHMETNSNQQLCDLINEKWDLGIVMNQVKNYMRNYQLKRVNIIRTPRRKKEEEIESGNYHPEPKKQGHPIKYTQEVVDYIKDNYVNTTRNKLIQQVNNMFGLDLNLDRFKGLLASKGINKQSCKENKNPGVEPNEAFDDDPDIDDLELDD